VRRLYTLLLILMLPLVLLRLALRGLRNRDYWRRIPERFGFVNDLGSAPLIWLHAVSVGEARAAVPLVKRLAEEYVHHRFLITTMTPTGSATVRQTLGDWTEPRAAGQGRPASGFGDWTEPRAAGQGRPASGLGERVAHCYVPYDYPSSVRRFLDRTHPVLAVIMETELWPNLFHECRARGIPLLVANVRLSERSARRYRRVAPLVRATLGQVSRFGVQNEADAARLRALGAPAERVAVTGSIKFELSLPASLIESAEVLRRAWGADRPVWLAASTHDGEDEPLLLAHADLRRQARFANALLVLVPRHPERFGAVVRLSRKLGFNTAQRSDVQEAQVPRAATASGVLDPAVEVLVGDTMGELQLFYAAADVAFVGGSLVATGGHNLLEAAAVGKPVVFGPHMFNFAEIAQMTLERGAGVQVHTAADVAPAIGDFLGNANRRFGAGEAGRKMVEENRGALLHTVNLIEKLLPV
jgi:3-deoxy-D-manno-octulosonic-acid transferase